MAKYQSTTDEGKCVFCEIIKDHGKTPGVFWEDAQFLAFLSTWPNTEGFSILVPKKHFDSDVLAMPDEPLRDMVIAAKTVSNILLKYFEDVGRVGLIMEGTGVDHAHIKLIPLHGTAHMKQGVWKQYLGEETEYFDTYDGQISSGDGPRADPNELAALAEQLKTIR